MIARLELSKSEPWALELWVGDDSEASCGESRIDWGSKPVARFRAITLVNALHRLIIGKSRTEWLS